MGLTESKLFTDCLEFVMAAPNPKLVRCLIYALGVQFLCIYSLFCLLFQIGLIYYTEDF